MALTHSEIVSELGRIKEKLAEKEPIRDKADIELMKIKCEIKELKNKQSALKKQLKEIKEKTNHSAPPKKKKAKKYN